MAMRFAVLFVLAAALNVGCGNQSAPTNSPPNSPLSSNTPPVPPVDAQGVAEPNVKDAPSDMWSTSRGTASGEWSIQWCMQADRLVFVVFSGPAALGKTMPVVSGSHRGRDTYTLYRPDGSNVEIPFGVQLMEIINDRYHESTRVVTRSAFEAFLESNPDVCTIERLVAFADARDKHGDPK